MQNENLITHTADIAATYVATNKIAGDDVPKLVQEIYEALSGLVKEQEEPETKEPVVSVRASVKPDHLVCLACGKRQKTLKRHLQVAHAMSPDEYRDAYGLPDSYPMTAPEYSERRRVLAKEIGLGKDPNQKRRRQKKG